MAELILTDEEKAANSWLDLDDASLGRLVKKTGLMLKEEAGGDEKHSIWRTTAAILLVSMAHEANAETSKMELSGVTHRGKSIGDWKITIQRKKGQRNDQ